MSTARRPSRANALLGGSSPQRRADRGPGPSLRAVVALVICGLALVATSQARSSLEDRVVGEAILSGGQTLERELRVHVDRGAGGATAGRVNIELQAGSGLDTGYSRNVTLAIVAASDELGSFAPSDTFPVERCASGCDLTYRIALTARDGVLPGSVVRYAVHVRLEYDDYRDLYPTLLSLDLASRATGPVVSLWSLGAGVLALLAGIAIGPAIDRRLGSRRRRWPVLALMVAPVLMIAWMVLRGAVNLAAYDAFRDLARSPALLFALIDPWSAVLLGTLAWGTWRGLRSWPQDGGWLLGMAAVATVGLGGLWLAWISTLEAVVQPIVLGIPFIVFGGLGGIVVGQAWRTDERARHDRWTGALAVVGHGIIIAGFGFLTVRTPSGPTADPSAFLLLVPATLVAWAFRRWLDGPRAMLILLDVVIAAIGLFGLWAWMSLSTGIFRTRSALGIDDVAVAVAVAAAVVAAATAIRGVRRQSPSEGTGDRTTPPTTEPALVTAAGGPGESRSPT